MNIKEPSNSNKKNFWKLVITLASAIVDSYQVTYKIDVFISEHLGKPKKITWDKNID